LKVVNEPPPVVVQVNKLKSSTEEIVSILKEMNVPFEESGRVPGVIRLLSPVDLDRFRPFREGKVIVQEEASALAPLLLNPEPGSTVVDLAAAPGGKTVALAELMKNRGKIYAIDVNEKRAERMKELLKRTGVRIADILVEDGRKAPEVLGEEIADRVLLDAPCTSSGTIQRNPEIRWRLREEEDILEFVSLQRELMEAGWKLLKPGGRMLYSTCSIFKEEDEENVQWFLEKHPEARLIPLKDPYDPGFLPGTMRAWPHRHGTIGFFYGLMEKS
jgi:16S rRNA (cytosine967-C5)-methyltransferase